MVCNIFGFEEKNNFHYGRGVQLRKSTTMATKVKNLGGLKAKNISDTIKSNPIHMKVRLKNEEDLYPQVPVYK